MQEPRRRRGIPAALLGFILGACGFPDVRYDSADDDGGALDAAGDAPNDAPARDATATDAQPADAGDASDAAITADASASDGGDSGVDAEAGGGVLASASSFAILANTMVTNTGQSSITGDVGVAPATTVSGLTPAMVKGTIHEDDAVAVQSQQDVGVAYGDLSRAACTNTETVGDLGGLTLTPGVYCFPAAGSLTGPLVLDGNGDASAVFVFKIDGAFTAAASATVTVQNGASECNVFWRVAGSATIGANSTFVGSILATMSITLGDGMVLEGRALAEGGGVTLANGVVGVTGCP